MIAKCINGFFIIKETSVGQVSDFMTLTGLSIVPWREHFTFETLAMAPNYSLKGKDYLGLTPTVTIEGEPWDVFEANGFVFDFDNDELAMFSEIDQSTIMNLAGNRYVSPGLILPGSVLTSGAKVKSYTGYFSRNTLRWLYSEVKYE